MEPSPIMVVGGAVGFSVLLLIGFLLTERHYKRRQAYLLAVWTRVANRLGLELRFAEWGLELRGQVGDVGIWVGYGADPAGHSRGQPAGQIRFVVEDVHARVPPEIGLSQDSALSRVERALFQIDQAESGASTFDRAVELMGPPRVLQALLTTDARQALYELIVHNGGRVDQGRVVLHYVTKFDHEHLESTLRFLIQVVQLLQLPPAEVEPRLARNALRDPDPAVRRRCLEALCAGSETELIFETCSEALQDTDACVQLLAIEQLRPPGYDQRVAELLGHEAAAVREKAVLAATHYPSDTVEELLIERLRDAAAEVRLAASHALGKLGSVRAVEPLLACCNDRFQSSELRRAAREAIDAIQSRLGPAEAGQLSLVEDDEQGRLSLAQSSGMLSEPEER